MVRSKRDPSDSEVRGKEVGVTTGPHTSASGCRNMPQGDRVLTAVDWQKQQWLDLCSDLSLFLLGPSLAFAFHQDRNQESTMPPNPWEDVGKRANAPRCEPPDWDKLGLSGINSAGRKPCFGMGENPGDFPGQRRWVRFLSSTTTFPSPMRGPRPGESGIRPLVHAKKPTPQIPLPDGIHKPGPAEVCMRFWVGVWHLINTELGARHPVIGANLVEQSAVCCSCFRSKTLEY